MAEIRIFTKNEKKYLKDGKKPKKQNKKQNKIRKQKRIHKM